MMFQRKFGDFIAKIERNLWLNSDIFLTSQRKKMMVLTVWCFCVELTADDFIQ